MTSTRRRSLMLRRTQPPVWSPTNLAGLHLWYDSDDDSSFTFSSGTTVSQWNDKSGNDRHLTAGFAERVTVSSLKVVQFSPTSGHYLSADVGVTGHMSRPFTILVVANRRALLPEDGPDTAQRSIAGFVSGGGSGTKRGDGRVYRTTADAVAIYQGATLTNGTWGLNMRSVVSTFNGASSKLSVDGGSATEGNAGFGNSAGIFRVGHYGTGDALTPASPFEYWDGFICEIAVMSAAITDSELSNWHSYVAAKWGVAE